MGENWVGYKWGKDKEMSAKKMLSPTKKLASMAGCARTTTCVEGANIQCEIKTVNSRGLDIRLRLGHGLDVLEPQVRRMLADRLTRGSISCHITLQRDTGTSELVINQQALGAVLDALDALSGKIEADRPRLDGILAIKGVLETRETPINPETEEKLQVAIIDQIEIAIDELLHSRTVEGARLADIISARVNEIENLTNAAENHPSRQREVFIARLSRQVAELGEADTALSQERLHSEALVLATKADIREELDRLVSHISAARTLIANGGPVGRKLDFLAQEFNREANTLCSKSHAVELTTIGLDLKSVIDQLREQVANIE